MWYVFAPQTPRQPEKRLAFTNQLIGCKRVTDTLGNDRSEMTVYRSLHLNSGYERLRLLWATPCLEARGGFSNAQKKQLLECVEIVKNGTLPPNKNHPLPPSSQDDRDSAVTSILKSIIASWLSEQHAVLPKQTTDAEQR